MVDEPTRLRVIRAILGVDRKTFAGMVDVNPITVTYWEKGLRSPNRTSRKIIAELCEQHKIMIRPDGFPVPVS